MSKQMQRMLELVGAAALDSQKWGCDDWEHFRDKLAEILDSTTNWTSGASEPPDFK